jgi:hypothetical protein
MRHSFTQEAAAERDGLAQGHRWLFGHAAAAHERYNTSQLPSGFLVSSAEDMTHFVVAQLNGGRYGGARILSAATVAAMQAPGVPIGTSGARYGLGWKTALLAGVPVVEHSGDNFYYHGLVFLEPATRRGAVLLTNSNGLVASQAYTEIEHGVARLLAGQATGPSSMSLRTLYLLVDLVLAIVLALALWPLLRMHRWSRQLVARRRRGRPVRLRLALRAGAEIGLPVLVLVAARLALRAAGGQSWGEGLSLLPDTGAWLWTLCVVVLLTGVLRLAVARHAARPVDPAGPLDPAEPVDPVGPVGTRPATAPGAAG